MSEKRNFTLDKDAQIFADKMFPCEKPCDSYGVCEGCCERSLFQAGYNFAMRDYDSSQKKIEAQGLEIKMLRDQRNDYIEELTMSYESVIEKLDAEISAILNTQEGR